MSQMSNQGFFKKWWWLICAIFYLPFVVFFYIGKKSNNRLWIIFGTIYLILFAVIIALNNLYENESWFKSLTVVYCFIGIVHSYFSWNQYRDEFLKQDDDETDTNICVDGQRANAKMKKVKIIRPISLDLYKITTEKPIKMPVVSGCMGCLAKFGLLVFPVITLIIGILFLSVGIAPDDGSGTIYWLCLISLLVVVGGILWLKWIISGGKYKPGKSFYWWRLTKEKMLLIYKVIAVIAIIICIPLLIIEFKVSVLVTLVGVLICLYFIPKSFEVHEDVDYVANQELADIIGMEVDEKVQASYLKKDKIFLLTDKKIIFAYQEDNKWKALNKGISDISKVGIYTPMMMGSFFNTDLYFFLMFSDLTSIELKMDLGNKLTSNPDLFFKKFLTILDAVVLGKTDEKIASRRRVSVNNESKPSVRVDNEVTDVRKIDISNTILYKLRDATPIECGRTLEF